LRKDQKNVVGIFCKRFDSFEITHFEAMKYQWLRSSKTPNMKMSATSKRIKYAGWAKVWSAAISVNPF
jgi:hypothetical protein